MRRERRRGRAGSTAHPAHPALLATPSLRLSAARRPARARCRPPCAPRRQPAAPPTCALATSVEQAHALSAAAAHAPPARPAAARLPGQVRRGGARHAGRLHGHKDGVREHDACAKQDCETPTHRAAELRYAQLRTIRGHARHERLQQPPRLPLLRSWQRQTSCLTCSPTAHAAPRRAAPRRAFMQLKTSTRWLGAACVFSSATAASANHWAHVAVLSPVCAPSR